MEPKIKSKGEGQASLQTEATLSWMLSLYPVRLGYCLLADLPKLMATACSVP